MTNALKLILQEKGMTQAQLADKLGIHRQNVTRWVKRIKPMHEDYIQYIEENLGVKRKYFVDERRYTKVLDDNQKLELQDYLLRRKYELPTSTMSRYKYYKNIRNLSESELADREQRKEKYTIAYRRKKANVDIQELIRKIKKDINSVSDDISTQMPLSSLDCIESNIGFYQNFLYLRESNKITETEWNSINTALYMIATEDTNINADDVSLEIYKMLKENRKK